MSDIPDDHGPDPDLPSTGPAVEYMSANEVARTYGLSPQTVMRWADHGRLRFATVLGGGRRFARADVERIVVRPGGGQPAVDEAG